MIKRSFLPRAGAILLAILMVHVLPVFGDPISVTETNNPGAAFEAYTSAVNNATHAVKAAQEADKNLEPADNDASSHIVPHVQVMDYFPYKELDPNDSKRYKYSDPEVKASMEKYGRIRSQASPETAKDVWEAAMAFRIKETVVEKLQKELEDAQAELDHLQNPGDQADERAKSQYNRALSNATMTIDIQSNILKDLKMKLADVKSSLLDTLKAADASVARNVDAHPLVVKAQEMGKGLNAVTINHADVPNTIAQAPSFQETKVEVVDSKPAEPDELESEFDPSLGPNPLPDGYETVKLRPYPDEVNIKEPKIDQPASKVNINAVNQPTNSSTKPKLIRYGAALFFAVLLGGIGSFGGVPGIVAGVVVGAFLGWELSKFVSDA